MRNSYFYEVENKNQYKTASKSYIACRSSDYGDMLFTKDDIVTAKLRATKNPEDLPPDTINYSYPLVFIAVVASFALGVFLF